LFQFDAEFRRFSVSRQDAGKYDEFRGLVERLHRLVDVPFLISYTDPGDGDLLPINNDDNLGRALLTARPLLRVIVQRKGRDCSAKCKQKAVKKVGHDFKDEEL
jgi:partitioning defective protein 6